jgi:hypothetical protein
MNHGATTGLGLALVSTSLAALAAALLLLSAERTRRPALEGVLALQLDATGGLRAGRRPLTPQELGELLRLAAGRPEPPRLRLVPEPAVPWGMAQAVVARLAASGLAVELQLP